MIYVRDVDRETRADAADLLGASEHGSHDSSRNSQFYVLVATLQNLYSEISVKVFSLKAIMIDYQLWLKNGIFWFNYILKRWN